MPTQPDSITRRRQLVDAANLELIRDWEQPAAGQTIRCNACRKACGLQLLICAKCIEGSGVTDHPNHAMILWCSTACRDRDAKKHKPVCSKRIHRKCLHRAAELLQAAFYTWREAAYNHDFSKIVKEVDDDESSELMVYERLCEAEKAPFYPFPHGSLEHERDKEILLAFDSSQDIQVFARALTNRLLHGLVQEIDLTIISIRPRLYTVRKHDHRGVPVAPPTSHYVLSIMDKYKEPQLIDIAGAPFGNHITLSTVKTYALKLIDPFSAIKTKQFQMVDTDEEDDEDDDDEHVVSDLQARMATVFNGAIASWEKGNISGLRQLLRGNRDKFDAGKESLIAYIKVDLHKFVNDFRNGRIATPTYAPGRRGMPELVSAVCKASVSTTEHTKNACSGEFNSAAAGREARSGQDLADLEAAMAELLGACGGPD